MRPLYPALLASLLALSPLACKRSGGSAKAPADSTTARPSAPAMPKPLALPAEPNGLVHVAAPKDLLQEALSYSPGSMTARAAVAQALKNSGLGFESQVFAHVGMGRAWNMAIVKGQTIVHVPVIKGHEARLTALLSKLPAEGEFGAVRLKRPQGQQGPKVAFFDKQNNMLTLAGDLRGIATGPELGRAYGKQGVRITVTAEQAARYGAQLGARRATITGTGTDDLRIELEGAPALPASLRISEGALTGLLESGQIALGGSTKYVDYKKDVDGIMAQGRRQVSSLPGMAQGNAKELLGRAGGLMRTWNGRTMVGVGPANHVLVGFGTNDTSKMNNSSLHLIRGVQSNIKTIKSLKKFGVNIPNVPSVSFAPNKTKVGGQSIHVVALEGAKKYVPAEFHKLLTSNDRLRISMVFPKRASAGMVVIGPNSEAVLTRWLQDTQNATPGGKSEGHLASATVAVGANALGQLASPEFNPATLMGLSASRAPTKIVVKRRDQNYVIKLKRARAAAAGKPKTSAP
ncbi:MAG: hypothetical protein KUG77_20240 [Nannocystaceae bacterium]|nr:hypothetical protein [Nannocystaceae bacterium]